jgi:SAM-dependent methyltransferase
MPSLSASRGLDYVLRAKDDITFPVPPQEFINLVGGGDFHAIGEHFMMIFQEHCGLAPEATVLDIGCGCGRMAIPLARYLEPGAVYHGFDVVLPMVEWCRAHLTPARPNFHFHHAALKNTLYSAQGGEAAEYRFPFADGSFDFTLATSVFTHLLPSGMRRYCREMARALKPGGKALTTWFLLHRDNASWGHDHTPGQCRVMDPANPEAVVAFEETFVKEELRDAGLELAWISHGSWSGARGLSYQDLVLVSRPGA